MTSRVSLLGLVLLLVVLLANVADGNARLVHRKSVTSAVAKLTAARNAAKQRLRGAVGKVKNKLAFRHLPKSVRYYAAQARLSPSSFTGVYNGTLVAAMGGNGIGTLAFLLYSLSDHDFMVGAVAAFCSLSSTDVPHLVNVYNASASGSGGDASISDTPLLSAGLQFQNYTPLVAGIANSIVEQYPFLAGFIPQPQCFLARNIWKKASTNDAGNGRTLYDVMNELVADPAIYNGAYTNSDDSAIISQGPFTFYSSSGTGDYGSCGDYQDSDGDYDCDP